MVEVVTIPKKLLKKGELVILPRKDYEELLSMKKQLSGTERKGGLDLEGGYRPGFVRKILKRSKEKAPAASPRYHPNSSRSGGSRSEKAVRAVTAMAMVTNAMPTISQP